MDGSERVTWSGADVSGFIQTSEKGELKTRWQRLKENQATAAIIQYIFAVIGSNNAVYISVIFPPEMVNLKRVKLTYLSPSMHSL